MGITVVKLKDVLDRGTSNLSANKLNDNEGDYPVYGATGLFKNVDFFQQDKEYLAIIKDGAGVGRVYHYPAKSSILGTMQYLFPKDNINIRFAYYYLMSLDFKKYTCGAAIPHIYYKDYCNETLALPSKEEQEKIVSILDKADEIRAKKKLANDKLDEFLKSTFITMFGDPVKNDKGFDTTILQNIGSFKNGINYNASDNGYSIKCIGVGDFKNGTVLNSIDNLNSVEVNQPPNKEYFLRKNDIVFVRSNGSKELVGRTLLINTDLQENIVYSGFCIRLRVEQENINNMFLLQLLNTKPIKDNMKNDGHGCNIKSLNQTILGNIPIIVPPIDEQYKFAKIVEKVEDQKQKNEQTIEQMNKLFNSLSQRSFKCDGVA